MTSSKLSENYLLRFQKDIKRLCRVGKYFINFGMNLRSVEEAELSVNNGYGDASHFLVTIYSTQQMNVWLVDPGSTTCQVLIRASTCLHVPLLLHNLHAQSTMYDIIAELVSSCNPEANPFAVNFQEINGSRIFLASASIIYFMQQFLVECNEHFIQHGIQDMETACKIHFSSLENMATIGKLPIANIIHNKLGTMKRVSSTGTPIIGGWGEPDSLTKKPQISQTFTSFGDSNGSEGTDRRASLTGSGIMNKLAPLVRGREKGAQDAENPFSCLNCRNKAGAV